MTVIAAFTDIDKVGKINEPVAPGDQHPVTFDISTWLGTASIGSVVYSAVDEYGTDATAAVLVSAKNTNTATVLKPYIKGGTTNRSYTVKCLVTANNPEISKRAFFIKFFCREVAS